MINTLLSSQFLTLMMKLILGNIINAMYTIRRSSYRKKSFGRSKKNYKSYSKKSSPIKKIVRAEVARIAENKTAQYYDSGAGLWTVTSGVFNGTNIFPLGPSSSFSMIINQGTSQGSRVGNRIRTKKLVVKGTLRQFGQNASTNTNPKPVQVKIWIMYDKENPSIEPNPKGEGDFFQLGGTSASFQNNLTDLWATVNSDRYRVLATRQFKLGYHAYPANAASGNAQYYGNLDFNMNCNFSIDCTKFYPKDVRFNDNNASPITRGLFMLIHYVAADGSALAQDQELVQVQYAQDYVFEDC